MTEYNIYPNAEALLAETFLTTDQVAELLKIDPRTVRSLIAYKEFPAYKIGKQYRIPFSGFEKYMRESAST